MHVKKIRRLVSLKRPADQRRVVKYRVYLRTEPTTRSLRTGSVSHSPFPPPGSVFTGDWPHLVFASHLIGASHYTVVFCYFWTPNQTSSFHDETENKRSVYIMASLTVNKISYVTCFSYLMNHWVRFGSLQGPVVGNLNT